MNGSQFDQQEAVLARSVALYGYHVKVPAVHWQLENGVWWRARALMHLNALNAAREASPLLQDGRVVVFTRGEFRDRIMEAVGDQVPDRFFEQLESRGLVE